MTSPEWRFIKTPEPLHDSGFHGAIIVALHPSGDMSGLLKLNEAELFDVSRLLLGLGRQWSIPIDKISFKFICPESYKSHFSRLEGIDKSICKYKSYPDDKQAEFYLSSSGKMKFTLLSWSKEEKAETKGVSVKAEKHEKSSRLENRTVKVLIVDDSKTVRKLIGKALRQHSDFEIVGETGKPREVKNLVEDLKPDVMTLDIHMPEMNGVEVLQDLYKTTFVPAVVVSSLNINEGSLVMDALEEGAFDYLKKPSIEELAEMSKGLAEKLRAAARQKRKTTDVEKLKRSTCRNISSAELDMRKLIAIGASTGGTEAIKAVLAGLPEKIPPVVISQHIPPYFSKAFAERLNNLFPFEVKEAEDGEELTPNKVLVTPGGHHMEVKDSARLSVHVYEGPPIGGHVPAIDVMFESITKVCPRRTIGIILTGMGKDGAQGLKSLRDKGAYTVAQDEESCVVYGMPRVAMSLDAACKQTNLNDISEEIVSYILRSSSGKDAA